MPTVAEDPVGLTLPRKTSTPTGMLCLYGVLLLVMWAMSMALLWPSQIIYGVVSLAGTFLVWRDGRPTTLQDTGIRTGWRARFVAFTDVEQLEPDDSCPTMRMRDGSHVTASFAGLTDAERKAAYAWIEARIDAPAVEAQPQ